MEAIKPKKKRSELELLLGEGGVPDAPRQPFTPRIPTLALTSPTLPEGAVETDEELARRLHEELNGCRHKRRATSKPAGEGASLPVSPVSARGPAPSPHPARHVKSETPGKDGAVKAPALPGTSGAGQPGAGVAPAGGHHLDGGAAGVDAKKKRAPIDPPAPGAPRAGNLSAAAQDAGGSGGGPTALHPQRSVKGEVGLGGDGPMVHEAGQASRTSSRPADSVAGPGAMARPQQSAQQSAVAQRPQGCATNEGERPATAGAAMCAGAAAEACGTAGPGQTCSTELTPSGVLNASGGVGGLLSGQQSLDTHLHSTTSLAPTGTRGTAGAAVLSGTVVGSAGAAAGATELAAAGAAGMQHSAAGPVGQLGVGGSGCSSTDETETDTPSASHHHHHADQASVAMAAGTAVGPAGAGAAVIGHWAGSSSGAADPGPGLAGPAAVSLPCAGGPLAGPPGLGGKGGAPASGLGVPGKRAVSRHVRTDDEEEAAEDEEEEDDDEEEDDEHDDEEDEDYGAPRHGKGRKGPKYGSGKGSFAGATGQHAHGRAGTGGGSDAGGAGQAQPLKVPKLPMVRAGRGWYRGRLLRGPDAEHGGQVLVEVPGAPGPVAGHAFDTGPGPFWLHPTSERIWRGSYKGKDWKHLGGGAWDPKPGAFKRGKQGSSLNGLPLPLPAWAAAHAAGLSGAVAPVPPAGRGGSHKARASTRSRSPEHQTKVKTEEDAPEADHHTTTARHNRSNRSQRRGRSASRDVDTEGDAEAEAVEKAEPEAAPREETPEGEHVGAEAVAAPAADTMDVDGPAGYAATCAAPIEELSSAVDAAAVAADVGETPAPKAAAAAPATPSVPCASATEAVPVAQAASAVLEAAAAAAAALADIPVKVLPKRLRPPSMAAAAKAATAAAAAACSAHKPPPDAGAVAQPSAKPKAVAVKQEAVEASTAAAVDATTGEQPPSNAFVEAKRQSDGGQESQQPQLQDEELEPHSARTSYGGGPPVGKTGDASNVAALSDALNAVAHGSSQGAKPEAADQQGQQPDTDSVDVPAPVAVLVPVAVASGPPIAKVAGAGVPPCLPETAGAASGAVTDTRPGGPEGAASAGASLEAEDEGLGEDDGPCWEPGQHVPRVRRGLRRSRARRGPLRTPWDPLGTGHGSGTGGWWEAGESGGEAGAGSDGEHGLPRRGSEGGDGAGMPKRRAAARAAAVAAAAARAEAEAEEEEEQVALLTGRRPPRRGDQHHIPHHHSHNHHSSSGGAGGRHQTNGNRHGAERHSLGRHGHAAHGRRRGNDASLHGDSSGGADDGGQDCYASSGYATGNGPVRHKVAFGSGKGHGAASNKHQHPDAMAVQQHQQQAPQQLASAGCSLGGGVGLGASVEVGLSGGSLGGSPPPPTIDQIMMPGENWRWPETRRQGSSLPRVRRKAKPSRSRADGEGDALCCGLFYGCEDSLHPEAVWMLMPEAQRCLYYVRPDPAEEAARLEALRRHLEERGQQQRLAAMQAAAADGEAGRRGDAAPKRRKTYEALDEHAGSPDEGPDDAFDDFLPCFGRSSASVPYHTRAGRAAAANCYGRQAYGLTNSYLPSSSHTTAGAKRLRGDADPGADNDAHLNDSAHNCDLLDSHGGYGGQDDEEGSYRRTGTQCGLASLLEAAAAADQEDDGAIAADGRRRASDGGAGMAAAVALLAGLGAGPSPAVGVPALSHGTASGTSPAPMEGWFGQGLYGSLAHGASPMAQQLAPGSFSPTPTGSPTPTHLRPGSGTPRARRTGRPPSLALGGPGAPLPKLPALSTSAALRALQQQQLQQPVLPSLSSAAALGPGQAGPLSFGVLGAASSEASGARPAASCMGFRGDALPAGLAAAVAAATGTSASGAGGPTLLPPLGDSACRRGSTSGGCQLWQAAVAPCTVSQHTAAPQQQLLPQSAFARAAAGDGSDTLAASDVDACGSGSSSPTRQRCSALATAAACPGPGQGQGAAAAAVGDRLAPAGSVLDAIGNLLYDKQPAMQQLIYRAQYELDSLGLVARAHHPPPRSSTHGAPSGDLAAHSHLQHAHSHPHSQQLLHSQLQRSSSSMPAAAGLGGGCDALAPAPHDSGSSDATAGPALPPLGGGGAVTSPCCPADPLMAVLPSVDVVVALFNNRTPCGAGAGQQALAELVGGPSSLPLFR